VTTATTTATTTKIHIIIIPVIVIIINVIIQIIPNIIIPVIGMDLARCHAKFFYGIILPSDFSSNERFGLVY
jgi:hypothetical protein